MIEHKNLVKDTTTSTGTGSIVLAGTTFSGFQNFAAGHTDGAIVRYNISDRFLTEVEVGTGTWTESTNTLARDTVIFSTNGNAKVNFSAGEKLVSSIMLAEDLNDRELTANKDASGGYAGLDGFKIKLKNAAGSVISTLESLGSAARNWQFPDFSGTVILRDASNVIDLSPSASAKIKAAFGSGNTQFQSNEANSYTALRVVPSGTGDISYLVLFNSENSANSSYLDVDCNASASVIDSNKTGTGVTKPLYLKVGGNSLITLDTTNEVAFPYGQLRFPATQNPSSNANTLDDEERGTWTPSLYGSTTAGTPSGSPTLEGRYHKFGRQVTITGYIYVPSWSVVPAGNLIIGGVPFTNGSHHAGISVGYQQCQGTGSSPLQGNIAASNTIINLYYISAGTSTAIPAANVAYQIYFSASYFTTF